ncbi:hypothetical protein RFI_29658 [Reticulomyxa filosa]|uniref:Uncharacterized protein n=1 Tax=Reticulomyxa filosa TaxID=46433 RepID=X6M0N4_RETFI|nr:hypothetical protein RFI_29658 [Reticulomyxa filosa]|eukprot:ETO07733.1 hypothetical protein RFI_29658 [Reticulomyxa filosa]
MIPFMAGILYDNIESKKDSSGSGLLYFWKLLHSPSLSQLSYIHRMIFHMRCLDVCKADTESPFLSSQLQNCHKNLIDSFKSFLIAWINIDRFKNGNEYRIVDRSFHKAIVRNIPNLSNILVHPDIYLCIIGQLGVSQTSETKKRWSRLYPKCGVILVDILEAIALKVSETQINRVIEVLLDGLHNGDEYVHKKCAKLIEEISWKMNKKQLKDNLKCLMDIFNKNIPLCAVCTNTLKIIVKKLNKKRVDITDILLDGFQSQNIDLHEECAKLIKIISLNMNKKQLDDAFRDLINMFINKKISYCNACANTIRTIVVKLNKKQMDNALKYIVLGFNTKDIDVFKLCAIVLKTIVMKLNKKQLEYICKCLLDSLEDGNEFFRQSSANLLEKISMKLNKKQPNNTFHFMIDGLQDKRKVIRHYCVRLIETLLKKWKPVQADVVFEHLMNKLINNKDKGGHWLYKASYTKILVQLNEIHLDTAFKYLIKGLKRKKQRIHKLCIDLLIALLMKWNQTQLDNFVMYLLKNGSKYKNDVRYLCAQTIQKLKLNEKQLSADVFNYLVNGLKKDPSKNVQYSCAESIGRVSVKLNNKQLNTAWECLINKLNNKNEDIVAMKLSKQQLSGTLKCLMNGVNDGNENGFVQKYCAYSLERKNNLIILSIICSMNSKNEEKDIRFYCADIIEAISSKLSKRQIENTFKILIDNLNTKNRDVRISSAKGLKVIALRLNKGQLDNLFHCLKSEFKDKDSEMRFLYADILRKLVPNSNDQLDDLLECLQYGLEDEYDQVRYFCENILQTISTKVREQQLTIVCKFLIDGFNHFYKNIGDLCIKVLGTIVMKLDDEQLCLLLNSFLKEFKNISVRQRDKVNSVLSKISDDMWRRVTITALKENTKIKMGEKNIEMEFLAFGLLLYNPRMQFDHNDNNDNIINSEAFNELKRCYDKKFRECGFLIQQKWSDYDTLQIKLQLQHSNNYLHKDRYTSIHEAAKLGNVSQLNSALEYHHIDINDICNEHGQTPLHVAIHNKHWDTARYCIEQGAWIDVSEGYLDADTAQTPCGYISELIEEIEEEKNIKENKKEYSEMIKLCKLILKKRTIFPMKQIEYATDYVKDKLIDEDGVSKVIDADSYQTLLIEGASFLLGMNQKELKEMLINDNLFYWAIGRNVKSIEPENLNPRRFDSGWHVTKFLRYRIFLLFEICVRLKRDGKYHIELPKNTTFEKVYEKGLKELQVQLTTYWDYITGVRIHNKCPDLLDDWSSNVVDRLVNLKPISSKSECCEMSLVVGHKGHTIYLSLCKTFNYILVRIDNRWMKTVPSNTHPKKTIQTNNKRCKEIQPYVVAYFPCNSENINKNKKWLKNYIKYAFAWRNEESNKSMEHLYSDIQSLCNTPREGDLPSIVKNWPYLSVQTDAQNCYMRGHNVGYRIRLNDIIYEWFRDQECKSFAFKRSHHNVGINKAQTNQRAQ